MSTIKQAVLSTIEEHIDKQNAKGVKNYGKRLEDCDHANFDWQAEVIQELIDALQYQQMEIRKLKEEAKA